MQDKILDFKIDLNKSYMGQDPFMIVFHYTVTSFQGTLDLFQESIKNDKLGAQYLLNTNGDVYQLLNDNVVVKHAGVSYWDGFTELNKYAIGIENVNYGWSDENFGEGVKVEGSHNFWYSFPEEQVDSLTNLTADLIEKYHIKPYNILGHSDIAIPAGRKQDPGVLFPWEKFADNGIGLWYNTNVHCSSSGKIDIKNFSSDELKSLFVSKLVELGYGDPKYVQDPDNKPYGIKFTDNDVLINRNIDELIKNYNMHYRQDKGLSFEIDGRDFDIINSLLCIENVAKYNDLSMNQLAELYKTENADYLQENHLLDNIPIGNLVFE